MSDAAITHPFFDPRQQHEAASFGMWVFLATEIMFFGVLFGSYIATRIIYPEAFAEASRHTNVLLGTLNTVVLLTSSLTMTLAGLEYCLDFTEHLVPGINFAYPGSHAHGVELFFYLYFVMTGFHALHLIIGILIVAAIAWLAWRGQFVADSTPVELTSLYWHLVDIVWIFLYPLLYLVARA